MENKPEKSRTPELMTSTEDELADMLHIELRELNQHVRLELKRLEDDWLEKAELYEMIQAEYKNRGWICEDIDNDVS